MLTAPPLPSQVVPTRKVRSSKRQKAAAAAKAGDDSARGAEAAADEGEEEEEEAGAANLEDLLPRTDNSGSTTPTLLSMIGSANWKERNAGVEEVAALLQGAGNRIGPDVGELFGALRVRGGGGRPEWCVSG